MTNGSTEIERNQSTGSLRCLNRTGARMRSRKISKLDFPPLGGIAEQVAQVIRKGRADFCHLGVSRGGSKSHLRPQVTPHQGERSTEGRSALWNLLDQALGSPVYPTRWSIIDHLTGLDGDALDEDVYDRRRLRYLEALRRDENRLVRDEATFHVQVLTTAIPRDLPRSERRRRRKVLHVLEPPITFMTCSLRFNTHLHQLERRSYTVKEFEAFIDLLADTLGSPH